MCAALRIWKSTGRNWLIRTDLLDVRYAVEQAAQQEYAVIFPAYYFGQIAEAKHQPGTIAYSREIQLNMLQETTDEMARNGCKKIIIVNGHGGNESLLPYFAQTQLNAPHDYVVYDNGAAMTAARAPREKIRWTLTRDRPRRRT